MTKKPYLRLLSLMLTLCMVIGLMPAMPLSVGAAETVNSEDSLKSAIESATAGEVITLSGNITLAETLDIAGGKNIILDLNGCTITYNGDEDGAQAISNKGTLTVRDSSAQQSGKIYAPNASAIVNAGLDGGTIIIEGGTL